MAVISIMILKSVFVATGWLIFGHPCHHPQGGESFNHSRMVDKRKHSKVDTPFTDFFWGVLHIQCQEEGNSLDCFFHLQVGVDLH